MGYRNYIGAMPKKEYRKIKSFTIQEIYESRGIDKENDYIGPYAFGKDLYEFGKYCEFNPPKKSIKPFFKNKETQKYWNCETELMLVTKEFLAYIISTYQERIKEYYNKMIMPFLLDKNGKETFLNSVKTKYAYPDNKYIFDFSKITEEEQTALFKIIEHVRSMRIEWVQLTPYDLNKGDEITDSWKYEYGIFELVRIYKSFDWKKNIMFYYGY